jgi:hypothetical protein
MTEWYYRDPQSRKVGPLTDDEFEAHVAAGDIRPETRVWRSGLADWTTYAALLAHEAHCLAAASGPAASSAPESSSYSTLIALGASKTNRPPHGAGSATPVATDPGYARSSFEKCPECREEVAAHLFKESGRRRVCGFCLVKSETKARRDRLREARGVDSNWIGKFLVRCALIAAVFVLARVILFELKNAGDSVSTLPAVEDASGPMPTLTSAPAVAPRRLVPAASPGDAALPPDIDLVPAGR